MTLIEVAQAAFGTTPWRTADLLALPDKSWHETMPVTVQYALARNRDGGARAMGRYLGSGIGVFAVGKSRNGSALWRVGGPLISREIDDSDLFL